jgi:ppGpp synthetase/RelA/SpoT-type nucleotidyltranferase
MSISENVITEAVARYERERDRYLKLAARVADICRTDIVEGSAIRAQVTSRAKSRKSFESKLRRDAKSDDKNYVNVDEVFQKIGDLAGVRVATYQPETLDRVTEAIKEHFSGPDGEKVQVEKKEDPTGKKFYRATHCQVILKEEELVGTYENLTNTSCEIQVCSMMAHVWNEIEHDIGYKPPLGELPEETELGLLQALGHLTRSGDEIITRLLEANLKRLEGNAGDFQDVYGFVARLRVDFPTANFSLNAGPLYDELQNLKLTSRDKLKDAIGVADFGLEIAKKKIEEFNEYLEKKEEDKTSFST